MPQIIPIKDLKNTSAISEMCHKKMSLYILQKTAMVTWSS